MKEKLESRRILSLDAFKGFAAFMILLVHGVVFGIFTPDPALIDQLTVEVPIYFLVLLAPVILMATWFTAFLVIAGMTIAFSFVKESYKDSPNYSLVLKKKLINALALTLLGALYGPLLSHTAYNGGNFEYSLFTGLITNGFLGELNVARFYGHSVFAGIAMGMVVIAIMFYLIFAKFTLFTERSKLIRLMVILEFVSIFFTFLLEYYISSTGVYDIIRANSPLLYNILNRFFGGRHSMLPQLFFAFSGSIFGIIMASDSTYDVKHREIRIYGWYKGVVYFLIFLIITLVTHFDYVSMITAENLSVLFHLGNLGMLHWLVTYFFERFDFRGNYELGVKRSAFLRTFAPVTMTVYCTEAVFAASLRRIYIMIFGPNIFPWNGTLNVVFMIIIISFWYFLIKLWSRVNFFGSFEWGVVFIMKLFGTQSSRLEVKNKN